MILNRTHSLYFHIPICQQLFVHTNHTAGSYGYGTNWPLCYKHDFIDIIRNISLYIHHNVQQKQQLQWPWQLYCIVQTHNVMKRISLPTSNVDLSVRRFLKDGLQIVNFTHACIYIHTFVSFYRILKIKQLNDIYFDKEYDSSCAASIHHLVCICFLIPTFFPY